MTPEQIKALTDGVKELVEPLKAAVKKQEEEMATKGHVTAETAKLVETHTKNYDELRGELDGFKTALGRGGFLKDSEGNKTQYKSLGQMVVDQKLHEEMMVGKQRTTSSLVIQPYLGEKDMQGNRSANFLTDEHLGPEGKKSALDALSHVTASRFDGEGRRLIPPTNLGC